MHVHTGMTLPFFYYYLQVLEKVTWGTTSAKSVHNFSCRFLIYTQVNGKVNTLRHACNSSQHSKGHGVKVI